MVWFGMVWFGLDWSALILYDMIYVYCLYAAQTLSHHIFELQTGQTHFFQMVYNTRHISKTLGMIFRCINAFPDWAFAISSFFYVSPQNMTLPHYDHQNQQLKDSKWKHSIIWHKLPREYDKKNCTSAS